MPRLTSRSWAIWIRNGVRVAPLAVMAKVAKHDAAIKAHGIGGIGGIGGIAGTGGAVGVGRKVASTDGAVSSVVI